MTKSLELKTEEQRKSGARSNFYLALSRIFVFPEKEIIESITDGTLQKELIALIKELPYTLRNSEFLEKDYSIENEEEFQSNYIRVFDVSPGGPPCPLYEGLYYPDRRKIMEELMRFYEHFGLKPDIKKNELPDHISMELEFLHFLTFRETQALGLNKDRSSILLAERDFLERHPLDWIPQLLKKLEKAEPPEFYIHLFNFLNGFLKLDLQYVKGHLEKILP